MSFNSIRENKIIAKICKSTVLSLIRILMVKIELPAKKQILLFFCKTDTFKLFELPKDTLIRIYLTSLQLVTWNVWRR